MVPSLKSQSHSKSTRAILTVKSTDSWDFPLHMGSQVVGPNYDMDAYMATLFGDESWNLCCKFYRA